MGVGKIGASSVNTDTMKFLAKSFDKEVFGLSPGDLHLHPDYDGNFDDIAIIKVRYSKTSRGCCFSTHGRASQLSPKLWAKATFHQHVSALLPKAHFYKGKGRAGLSTTKL